MQVINTSALEAVKMLNGNGYKAYLVGGCVRDILMGNTPGDYDITTSAMPDEILSVFKDYKAIPTGIKHGTVTVIIIDESLEITTFRTDGEYENHRKPKEVTFTRSLEDDLSRRDFTMNAIAYNPDGGITDLFSGHEDIKKRIIRAVGDPLVRFEEDALRILRALRFASVLGFEIEENTRLAIHEKGNLLHKISKERIFSEIKKMLCGKWVKKVLLDYEHIIKVVIPGIEPCIGFDQKSPHHMYDVYTHSVYATEYAPPKPSVRLAALLHDVGKPVTFSMGADGRGHFYGHTKEGMLIADKILSDMKADNNTKEQILTLIRYHDTFIDANEASVKKYLGKIENEVFFDLLDLKCADDSAKISKHAERVKHHEKVRQIAKDILNKGECFSLRHLNLNGTDLIELGFRQGKQVGNILSELLENVISGKLENNKAALIGYVKLHHIKT